MHRRDALGPFPQIVDPFTHSSLPLIFKWLEQSYIPYNSEICVESDERHHIEF